MEIITKINMYEEKQKLKWAQPIFWGITLMTLLPILVFYEKQDGWIVWLVVGGTLLFTGGLLFSMKQTVRIDEGGIHFKQTPLLNKFKTMPWTTIQNWELRKINALTDFGGWGIRYTGSKTGYIMEGDYGLELGTGAKKKTVLSIKNRGEVERLMQQYTKE